MTARVVFGWLVVGGFLLILADIPATSELAVSFAYLMLVAALLAAGPAAFDNLTRLVTKASATPTGGTTIGVPGGSVNKLANIGSRMREQGA